MITNLSIRAILCVLGLTIPPEISAYQQDSRAIGAIPVGIEAAVRALGRGPEDRPSGSTPLSRLREPIKLRASINRANRTRYTPEISRIAKRHQLDPALIHAVISAESGYDPQAVSPRGAMGLMQLMPATAERFGVRNAFDPIANINAGTRYLRILINRFKNIRLALAAYNAGESVVSRYRNSVPPYQETRQYIVRVLNYYMYYRQK